MRCRAARRPQASLPLAGPFGHVLLRAILFYRRNWTARRRQRRAWPSTMLAPMRHVRRFLPYLSPVLLLVRDKDREKGIAQKHILYCPANSPAISPVAIASQPPAQRTRANRRHGGHIEIKRILTACRCHLASSGMCHASNIRQSMHVTVALRLCDFKRPRVQLNLSVHISSSATTTLWLAPRHGGPARPAQAPSPASPAFCVA